MPVQTRIQVRRDTYTNWTDVGADPVLALGEISYDTTNKKFKVGDGSTAWSALSYTKMAWADIPDKPSTFAPSTHASTHATGGGDAITIGQSQVTSLTTDLAAKATNPMTAVGDLIVGGTVTSGVAAPTRLALGTANHVLTSNGTTATWGTSINGTSIPSSATLLTSTSTAINGTTIPSSATLLTTTSTASEPSANTNSASSIGYVGIPQVAGTTGALTLSKSHSGKMILTSASRTITIPANSSVPLEIGTTVIFISGASVTTTIAITSDTLLLAGTGATGTRTLAQYGVATAIKVDANTWIISGNGLT